MMNRIKELFENFKDQKVLIIGDVMVDAYLWGNVERISPEAPVPIVAVNKRENRLGGAANVALNIKAMGAEAILCSVVGKDDKGDLFKQLLEEQEMTSQGILNSTDRITTTKFRILGNNTQMLRVDEEIENELTEKDKKSFIEHIAKLINNNEINAVIFEDYDKGIISPDLINNIVSICKKNNIPVSVDPKKKNFLDYVGVSLFKPNLKELKEGLKLDTDLGVLENLKDAVQILHTKLKTQLILVTLSEKGVFISEQTDNGIRSHLIPAHLRSIADVSGAGDTVISLATLCLNADCRPEFLAGLSNLAGGQVCEKVGVVPVDREKLYTEAIRQEWTN